jgi:hypothetical protein
MKRDEVRTYKGDLDVSKIKLVYTDSSIYKQDSIIVCKGEDTDINLYLHAASGSRNTYMIKNTGRGVVYVYLSPEDTFDLDIGDEWAFTEIFPCESIEITDYAPGSWVMLDFHFLWDFRYYKFM